MIDLANTIIVLCGACCCTSFFLILAAWITLYVGKSGEVARRKAFAAEHGLWYDEVSEQFYNPETGEPV